MTKTLVPWFVFLLAVSSGKSSFAEPDKAELITILPEGPHGGQRFVMLDSLLISSRWGTGIILYDVSNLTKPHCIGAIEEPRLAIDTAARENLVCTVGWRRFGDYAKVEFSGEFGLNVIDIDDPRNPTIIASASLEDRTPRVVAMSENMAFVVSRREGPREGDVRTSAGRFFAFDISDPHDPREVERLDTEGDARAMHVRDGFVFILETYDFYHQDIIGNRGAALLVIDARKPGKIRQVAKLDMKGNTVAFHGDYAYVGSDRKLTTVNIARPKKPRIVHELRLKGYPNFIVASTNRLFVSGGWDWNVFDIEARLEPCLLGQLILPAPPPIAALSDTVVVTSAYGTSVWRVPM